MPISFFKTKAVERPAPAVDNPLAQFEAEAESDAAPSPVTEIASRPLSLEAVLMRGVPVFWPEAVAVLEATCAQLGGSDGPDSPVPGPADIFIASDGTVRVRAGSGRGESVQRLARTMHSLTSGQAIPAPLRLFVTKWIGTEGGHTIAEFAGELAYFARPNGAQLIRELYQRVAQAAPVKAAQPRAAAQKPPVPVQPRKKRRRSLSLAVAAVLGFGGLAITLLLLGSSSSGATNSSDVVAGVMQRVAEFARMIGEVRLNVTDMQAQLTAHIQAGEAGSGQGTAEKPAPTRSGAASRGSAPQAARRLATVRTAPPLNPAPTVAATPPAAPPAIAAPVPLPEVISSLAVVPARSVPTDTIYSSGDQDVAPPRMLAPQLPPGPLVLGGSPERNVMELIVGDDGSVERVKLLTPARRMTDMMLLSGAKTWKFAPASKDGQTVRYRLALSWAP